MQQIERHLLLANRLAGTADLLARQAQNGNVVEEDVVAALRWAAGYLRREHMREDDLPGTLPLLRRVLPDFDALISGVYPASSNIEKMPLRLEIPAAKATNARPSGSITHGRKRCTSGS